VIRTEPAAGQKAPRDSSVRVVVSKGTDVVLVPDLTRKTIDEASLTAQQVGLSVTVAGPYSPGRTVRLQNPPPGRPIRRGAVVTISF
jgi:serine/threonine-protein kinase